MPGCSGRRLPFNRGRSEDSLFRPVTEGGKRAKHVALQGKSTSCREHGNSKDLRQEYTAGVEGGQCAGVTEG